MISFLSDTFPKGSIVYGRSPCLTSLLILSLIQLNVDHRVCHGLNRILHFFTYFKAWIFINFHPILLKFCLYFQFYTYDIDFRKPFYSSKHKLNNQSIKITLNFVSLVCCSGQYHCVLHQIYFKLFVGVASQSPIVLDQNCRTLCDPERLSLSVIWKYVFLCAAQGGM